MVGGGFYSGFAQLRVSEAWEFFGPGNSATDTEQVRLDIGHYRRTPIARGEDPVIGCILLRDVRFFAEEPAGPPPGFARNIVQGKRYDLADLASSTYFTGLLQRMLGEPGPVDLSEPWGRDGPVYGDPRLAPYRLGQQAFRAVVLNAYDRHCAITGSRIQPVLQAAHVRPLPAGGGHRLDNGLLLRSDVHTVFDRGYLAVDPSPARGLRQRRTVLRPGRAADHAARALSTGPPATSWNGTSTKSSKPADRRGWRGCRSAMS